MANTNIQISNDESVSIGWNGVIRDVREEYLVDEHRLPWIIGFSGGKDSTVVAHAVFEALLTFPIA